MVRRRLAPDTMADDGKPVLRQTIELEAYVFL